MIEREIKMKKIIILLFLFILGISGNSTKAEVNESSEGTYSVSSVSSEHQTKGIDDFYDIRWTPSFTEHFGVFITNHTDKAQTYELQVNKARTNKNGIIDYSNSKAESKTASYRLTQMIQLPKEVTVPAGQSQTVEGTLTFPKNSFNGILMAGIHVLEKTSNSSSSTVSNTVSYNLPFVVRGDNDVRPQAKLALDKVSLDSFSSTQSSLDVQLSNKKATFLKESNFQAEIKNKKGEVIIKQSSKINITPETQFKYPVKLPLNLTAGEYQLILNVKHAKDHWEFKQTFHISKEEIKTIHERTGIKDYSWIIYCIILFILFIGLLLIKLNCKWNKYK